MPEQTFSVMQFVRLLLLLLAFGAAVFSLTMNALRGRWKNVLLDLGIFLLLPLLWSVIGNVLRLCFPGSGGWGGIWLCTGLFLWPAPHTFLAAAARKRGDREGFLCALVAIGAITALMLYTLLGLLF